MAVIYIEGRLKIVKMAWTYGTDGREQEANVDNGCMSRETKNQRKTKENIMEGIQKNNESVWIEEDYG